MKRPYVCTVCGETGMSGERGRLPTTCRPCRDSEYLRRFREEWYPAYKAGPKYRAWRERFQTARSGGHE